MVLSMQYTYEYERKPIIRIRQVEPFARDLGYTFSIRSDVKQSGVCRSQNVRLLKDNEEYGERNTRIRCTDAAVNNGGTLRLPSNSGLKYQYGAYGVAKNFAVITTGLSGAPHSPHVVFCDSLKATCWAILSLPLLFPLFPPLTTLLCVLPSVMIPPFDYFTYRRVRYG